jgi:hypothetical protein
MESILDFSFPEVKRDPLQKDPSHYKDFLVNSINLFIAFMVKYVKDHRTTPNLVRLIEAFLRRMEAQWSLYSYRYFNSSYGFAGVNSSWDNKNISPVALSSKESADNKTVIDDTDFYRFSREFYNLIIQQGGNDMHDLNQLISIVLLGGYEKIYYYIDMPEYADQLAKVMSEHGAVRIDMRRMNGTRDPTAFLQMHRSPGEMKYIENAPIIPLFVRLAAFIVKTPESAESELLLQLDKNAVGQAVDNAISVAEAKKADAEAKKAEAKRAADEAKRAAAAAKVEAARKAFEASGDAAQSVIGEKLVNIKGGRRRTRHKKRSGHKKRSNKRSGKRSGRKSRRR